MGLGDTTVIVLPIPDTEMFAYDSRATLPNTWCKTQFPLDFFPSFQFPLSPPIHTLFPLATLLILPYITDVFVCFYTWNLQSIYLVKHFNFRKNCVFISSLFVKCKTFKKKFKIS